MSLFKRLKVLKILSRRWSYTAYNDKGEYWNIQFTLHTPEEVELIQEWLKENR